jgi:hypothetical protein
VSHGSMNKAAKNRPNFSAFRTRVTSFAASLSLRAAGHAAITDRRRMLTEKSKAVSLVSVVTEKSMVGQFQGPFFYF